MHYYVAFTMQQVQLVMLPLLKQLQEEFESTKFVKVIVELFETLYEQLQILVVCFVNGLY